MNYKIEGAKINLRCNRCSHRQEYEPRDFNKIPKKPHTRCKNCKNWIYINRNELIKIINDEKYQSTKKKKKCSTKKPKNGKIEYQLKILKLLAKGFYAQQISQKTLLSAKKLSQIINRLKDNELITQVQKFPKLYELTKKGKLLLDLDPKKDQKKNKKEKFKLEPLRVHKLRFKNQMIQKPTWLINTPDGAIIKGMRVKKVYMQNWIKNILSFPHDNFNGLNKIEVCNNVIIYNFNRNKKEQYVSSGEEFEDYLSNRIQDCMQAREFLKKKGFIIDGTEPILCQNPHFALASKNGKGIGALGKYLLMTVRTPEETREIDNSLGEDGEEETDNIEKAKSYFDVPEDIEKITGKIENIDNRMFSLESSMQRLAETLNTFVSLFKQPNNQSPKNNSGEMFR